MTNPVLSHSLAQAENDLFTPRAALARVGYHDHPSWFEDYLGDSLVGMMKALRTENARIFPFSSSKTGISGFIGLC